MKKSPNFTWTEEAQVAFDELKKQLSTRPVLAAPKEKEPLLLYIAATSQVVSVAIVVEREEEGKAQKVQRPVYFISEVLHHLNNVILITKSWQWEFTWHHRS